MAGEDDSKPNQNQNTNNQNSRPEEDNPFVAFRRYADEQISSMLHSVTGLPSMVNHPSRNNWAVFSDDNRYRDPNSRPRQNEDGNEGRDPASSGSGSGSSGDQENNEKQSSTSSRSRWSEYENNWPTHDHPRQRNSHPFDFPPGVGTFFDKSWFDDHLPSSYRIFHPHHLFSFPDSLDDSPGWPVTYLIFSPYSPLHLERQRGRHNQGVFSSLMSSLSLASDQSSERDPSEPQWREAFEDLLRLENGKPMLDRDSSSVSRRETPMDWLESMVKRGSLGDRWQLSSGNGNQSGLTEGRSSIAFGSSTYEEDDQKPEKEKRTEKADTTANEEKSEAMTEQDMYDRFLQDIEAREREFSREIHDSPMIRFLLEDRQRYKDALAEHERRLRSSEAEDTESWLDLVSGGHKHSVPEIAQQKHSTSDSSTTMENQNQPAELTEKHPHVISTSTTTERIRLRDGSVQTKTIKTKRFADGREESNESVEVVNPPQNAQDSSNNGESAKNDKSGWFWKHD